MAMVEPALATSASIETGAHSYMDWPAIFAGAVVAAAISFVLLTFGSAIGLSLTSAYEGTGISLAGFGIAAGLWLLWAQISSVFAGGYLTGRMRRRNYDATEHESDIRDGLHGLTVWAIGLLLGVMIAVSGISSGLSAATGAATTVATGAAAGAAGGVASAADEVSSASDLAIDRLLRSDTPAAPAANQAAPAANQSDPRAEIGRIIVASVANGNLDETDKQFLVQQVSTRTGLDQQQATARVDQMWAQVQQTEAAARDAAERARKIGVLSAFLIAASFLISGAAGYAGAVLGGNHRDKQIVVELWSPRG